MSNFGTPWTEQRIADLKKLYVDGFSASKIAAELGNGLTRNAVIGKIHRLGLDGRPRPPRKPRIVRPRTRHVATSLLAAAALGRSPGYVEPVIDIVIPVEQRRSLVELTDKTCRWPIGDPGKEDFYFCGGHPHSDKPYCAYHCRIAYQPKQLRPLPQRGAQNRDDATRHFREQAA